MEDLGLRSLNPAPTIAASETPPTGLLWFQGVPKGTSATVPKRLGGLRSA